MKGEEQQCCVSRVKFEKIIGLKIVEKLQFILNIELRELNSIQKKTRKKNYTASKVFQGATLQIQVSRTREKKDHTRISEKTGA